MLANTRHLVILLLFFLPVVVLSQSVNCPPCATGVCVGESLAGNINFSGYPTPIAITSVSGAATGSGSNLNNYTFSPGTQIVLNFEDGNGNAHTETINVSVDEISADFSYSQTGGCMTLNFNSTSTSSGSITNYSWSITQTVGSVEFPVTTMSGSNPSFSFPSAGTYEVCLTVTDNNGCVDLHCENVNVTGLSPSLTFLEDATDVLTPSSDSPYLVSYCNFSLNQDFDLYITDGSSISGGGSISMYIVELDGMEVYNGSAPPEDLLILEEDGGYSGYSTVTLTIVDSNGCSSSISYDVYLGQSILPQFTAQIADVELNCPETEIEIQTNISADNPEGVDYTLYIVCDPNDLSSYLEIWEWNQVEPDPFVYWTPPQSSCGCYNNSFYLVTTATHPCNPTPLPDQVDFQVALPADAEFTRSPAGSLCHQEEAEFEWLFANDLINGVVWCDADADWSITDEFGANVPINGTITDELMTHTFDGPGEYEVCLNLFSICGEPVYCETVCVNPPLTDVTLSPMWNVPALLCPGDGFTSTASFNNLDYCEPPTLEWELFLEGSSVDTYSGNQADIVDLEKGEYELVLTFNLSDCGEIEESVNFEVVAPPIISPQITGPFSNACQGDEICLDDWFCLDECGDPLTNFEMVIYQGFLSDCDNTPSGTIETAITSSIPNPPYDNCDPTTGCSYPWIAQPGQYTLWIKAENSCGPDFECITIDIPVPNIPVLTGDDEICLGESIIINSNIPGGDYTFTDCPGGCPNQGSNPGEYGVVGTEFSWTTDPAVNTPGDYTLLYSGDCIGSAEIILTINPLPEFTIASTIPNAVCEGDLVELSINYVGPSTLDYCEWYDDDNTLITSTDCTVEVNPNPGSNTYTVHVFDENGCAGEATIDIEEQTQPFSQDCSGIQASYCNNVGASIDLTDLLTPYPATGTISWALNGDPVVGTTLDLDGLAEDAYTLSWTWEHPNAPNCAFSGQCTFDITPPVVPNISGTPELCLGETVEIEIANTGGLEGTWNFDSCPGTCPTDATFNTFDLEWVTDETDTPGSYTVSYAGDCLETQTFVFVLNELPSFTILTDPGETLCADGDLDLSINYTGTNAVAECLWTDENTGTPISAPDCDVTVSPTTSPTTYAVLVTDLNGCEWEETIDIDIQAQPFTFDCAAIEPTYCDNEDVTIDLNDLVDISAGDPGFQWFLNGNPVVGTSVSLIPLDPAGSPHTISYTYTAPTAPFCPFEGDCSFNITNLTTPTLSNNSPACVGSEVTVVLSGNNGLVGDWTFQSCPGPCPTDFTTTATTLTWPTDENTLPGDYIIAYSGDCLETVTTTVTINENPDIQINPGPTLLICDGDEVNLTLDYAGASPITCQWTNLTTGTALVDDLCTVTTTITAGLEEIEVYVVDDNNCEARDTVQVQIQQQPFLFECPAITSFCDNEDVVIQFADLVDTNPGSAEFTWYLDGTPLAGTSLDIEPLDPAGSPYELSYVYTHADAPNCSFTNSCTFTVSALTEPEIANDGPLCLGEQVVASVSGNNGFIGNWTFTECPGTCPDDFTSTDTQLTWITDESDLPGIYVLEYAGNCLETVVDTIVLNPLPDFEITSDPLSTVCSSDTLWLGVNNLGPTDLATCTWTDDAGVVISPTCDAEVIPQTAAAYYYIEVVDLNGCANTDSLELNIQQQPFAFDCTAIEDTYCDNESVIIALTDLVGIDPEADFQWYLNGAPISGATLDIEPLDPSATPYMLTYEYLHPVAPNCLFTDSCSFTISDLTLPTVSGEPSICINEEVTFFSGNTNGFEGDWTFVECPGGDCPTGYTSSADSLHWITDDANDQSGAYTLQYTGVCLDTAFFNIEINPLPAFDVVTDPGTTVCAEDTISVSLNYTGASSITNCDLLAADGSPISEESACTYILYPAELAGPYTIEVTDANSCFNATDFDIDVQLQPFTYTCGLEATYCDNSTDVIDLDDQISPYPATGTLQWYLNGNQLADSQLDIFALNPNNYQLTYVYVHGDSPFCTFSDTCIFEVTELVRPELSGELAYCQGTTVELVAEDLEGFTGEWINTQCPQPPCLPVGTDPDSFIWNTTGAPIGTYVFEYQGLCLQTETISIEVLGIPEVEWTPIDDTPCLNECFDFQPDLVNNEDAFGWEYHTLTDTAAINGNTICFDDIGNPATLDICLWAENYHVISDTTFTCYVSDCEVIDPVFSPDAPPALPTQACPGVVLELGVNYALYDDCAFTLNGTTYADCEDILIPETPYGTFPYIVELGYSGCVDSLFGDVFIPEPPSATLTTSYEPCIGDVLANLVNLQGDALTYDWDIMDNPGNNYDYVLTNDNEVAPLPNPIPLSQVDFPTDTTLYVQIEVANFCESILLEDTINLIAPPRIEIDIANTSGDVFCLPQELSFEIGEFATAYIDSVSWEFQSIYDYGIVDTTYTNLQFPPPVFFQNNGQTDTVYVNVTAYNECGFDQDTISFVLLPPNVYLEMPDYSPGLCAGTEIQIPISLVEGDPYLGCDITVEPNIPGFLSFCDPDLTSITVSIPPSTPAGNYEIATTIEGCGTSTDYTQIEIFPDPVVDFEALETACTQDTINFFNLTTGAVSFSWNFGEPGSIGNTSILSFPDHYYALPGTYDVTLTATSDSGCVSQTIRQIDIYGPDPTINIDNGIVCSGSPVTTGFVNQDELLSLQWEFLLPGVDTLIYVEESGIENTFENHNTGIDIWEVSLSLIDIYGCEARAESQIFVLPQPSAYFTHGPLEGCAQGEEVQLLNESTPGVSSRWVFDDPGSGPHNLSFQRNPTHQFSGPGEYYVNLDVENSFGCKSSFTRRLSCNDLLVYVPNAFTPDGNRINEVFRPVIYGIEDIEFLVDNYYTFTVFNRWGDIVFQTHNPSEGWLGNSPDDDFYAQSEVFIWQVNIEFPEGAKEWHGHVTLVR